VWLPHGHATFRPRRPRTRMRAQASKRGGSFDHGLRSKRLPTRPSHLIAASIPPARGIRIGGTP
jgi:hypothetical protein